MPALAATLAPVTVILVAVGEMRMPVAYHGVPSIVALIGGAPVVLPFGSVVSRQAVVDKAAASAAARASRRPYIMTPLAGSKRRCRSIEAPLFIARAPGS